MKKVLVLIWFCAMIVAAQAQVDKGVSTTGQLGTSSDTRTFVDEKGKKVGYPRLTRTGKIIKTNISAITQDFADCRIFANVALASGSASISGTQPVVITERGICYSTTANPTIESNVVKDTSISGDGTGDFQVKLTELEGNTTYYIRAYATCAAGTVYGEEVVFKTAPNSYCAGLTANSNEKGDANGIYAVHDDDYLYNGGTKQWYSVVMMNGICVLKENLRAEYSPSTHHNILVNPMINSTVSKSANYYNYDRSYDKFGIFYNYCAAIDTFNSEGGFPEIATEQELQWFKPTLTGDRRGMCPQGWHVPTPSEASTLINGYTSAQLADSCESASYRFINEPLKFNSNFCGLATGQYAWNDFANRGSTLGYYHTMGSWGFNYSDNKPANVGIHSMPEHGHIAISLRCFRDGNYLIQPFVETGSYRDVTDESFVMEGEVISDGGSTVTQRGFCWSSVNYDPKIGGENTECVAAEGTGIGSFSATIAELTANTRYQIRAYATNSVGTYYGEVRYVTTLDLPTVTTTEISNITATTADGGGNITFNGNTSITDYGVCWSTSPNPTIENAHTEETDYINTGEFSSELTGLTPNTTYYVRAYATNSVGTAYGNEVTFTTLNNDGNPCVDNPTVTDKDGNTYNTVQIGNQCWMKENLKTTKFADGTTIATGSGESTVTPYRYAPNGLDDNVAVYGYLYNWAAVMHGLEGSSANPSNVQGICPDGWHVPSQAEWEELQTYVGQNYALNNDATYIAKALAGTTNWNTSTDDYTPGKNPSENNITGFSAMPAGTYTTGMYNQINIGAFYWSTTPMNENTETYGIGIGCDSPSPFFGEAKRYDGFSVRCVLGAGETPACVTTMDVSMNLGNAGEDFGKVTINSTNATSATWKDADGNTVGTWISGKTDVLPAGTYTVTLSADECSTNTVTVEVLASPICKVANINSNETGENGLITKLADIETNSYNVLSIAGQCWTRENLRVTKFADGTDIALGTEPSTTVAYRYYPGGAETNVADYGYLYNASAATKGDLSPDTLQGACPDGWHVPSDAEWRTLTAFVSAHEELYCEESENNSKALSSTTGWAPSDKSECAVGYDLTTNNLTGLGLLPSGEYTGSYKEFGDYAEYWSSSYFTDEEHLQNNEHTRSIAIAHGNTLVKHRFESNLQGLSIRCVRGEICRPEMSYTINLGNSDDFGKVTINSTSHVTSASWKDSNGVEIGTWVSGKTDILPVGKYTVELTGDCGTRTITGIRLDVSPICSVESINEDNEIAFEPTSYSPSYTGKFISKMKDIDENEYNVLQMGKICWIRENLKTKTFSNGTAIQHGANKEVSNNIAYYEYPANDEGNVAKYGLLYNWPAAMCNQVNLDPAKTVQGVCPDGWHLLGGPDMDQLGDDFDISKFICGGEEDWMAKALSTTTDWNSSSVECAVGNDLTTNNTTGAAMLPAGYRSGTHYEPLGNNGFLWLALGTNTTGAINMKFYYDNPEADIPSVDNPRSDAYSVRCIRGKICDPAIFDYTINMGNSDDFGRVTINSTNAISASWKDSNGVVIGTWIEGKTDILPVGTYTIVLSLNCGGTQTLSFDVLSSPICSSVSELNDNEISHTASYSGRYLKAMKDVDENSYNVVQIGSQCWITENLHATHFADGTEIPLGSGTVSYDVPVRYKSGRFDTDNACGYLYNWSAAMHGASSSSANPSNIQGICPVGWHMPSSAEWTQLTDYVSSKSAYWCDASDNTKIGKALASTLYWPAVSTECVPANTLSTNNTTGFNAIPAGVFDDNNNKAAGVDSLVYYWSATEVDAHHANVVGVVYLLPNVYVPTTGNAKNSVVSVRCLRGEGATPCETSMDYTINMGNSADFGRVTINSTNATSASWKDSNDVEIGTWVSGKTDILPVGKYTVELTGISCNKTLSFEILSSPICTVESVNSNETGSNGQISQLKDVENHTYNVVQIGSQCWMKENMKSKTYAGGDTLVRAQESNWGTQMIPVYDYPNGDAANQDTYGLLYSWRSATHMVGSDAEPSGVQGICPDGWHVPSAAEYTTLTNYVASQDSFKCGNDETKIVKALSANSLWMDRTALEALAAQAGLSGELTECMIAYDLTTNNATGFSMPGAGYYRGPEYQYDTDKGSGLTTLGLAAVLWTASGSTNPGTPIATALNTYVFGETISSGPTANYGCWSVRCVRGAGNNTPSVTTAEVSSSACTSATCGGNVIADGGSDVTARGVCWGTALNVLDINHNHTTDGTGTGEFTSEITDLVAGTTYYIRAYATNALGTFYGDTIVYTHTVEIDYTVNMGNSPDFGRVTINTADVTSATWRKGDEVIGTWTTKTDILPVGTYSVDITTPCISTTISGIEILSSPICTADAVGANEGAFTPSYSGTYINKLTDIDGNEYQVVQVGTQCWLKEDMRTKRYADGVAITSAYSDNATSEHVPHYVNHFTYVDNHIQLIDSPELLYNGFAALKMNFEGSDANPSGVQGICPDGWHVPSMTEVNALSIYVGAQEEYACEGDASKLGKALASNTGWLYDESDEAFTACSIGTDLSTNNATGLSLSASGIAAEFPLAEGLVSGYWTTSPNPDKYDNNGGSSGPNLIGKELFLVAAFSTNDNYSQNTCAKVGFMGVRCVRGAGNNTPSVTTSAVSAVTGTTATCGGNVTADGGSTVTARGVCWKKDNNGLYDKFPTVNDSKTTDGTGLGAFSSTLTGLEEGAKYYVRAYATNALGTFYGDTVSFTVMSSAVPPTVTLISAGPNVFSTTDIQIMADGLVVDDGGADIIATGICWGEEPGLTVEGSDHALSFISQETYFVSSSTGALIDCKDYYVRVYATNNAGTGYSKEVKVKAMLPSGVVETIIEGYNTGREQLGNSEHFGQIAITPHENVDKVVWKNSTGNEVGNGPITPVLPVGVYDATFYHECDGVYYELNKYDGENTASYVDEEYADMYKTSPEYYIPASPICQVSTVGDNETAYSTTYSGTYINKLTDKSGNEYNVVQIGEQCWMRENLRTTKYADGTPIVLGTDRYYPDNDTNNVAVYGSLYSWSAAMHGAANSNANPSGVQGVCPEGWHVPSRAEWTQLTSFVSGAKRLRDSDNNYYYRCSDTKAETDIAKSLASNTGWQTGTTTCGIGNSLLQNNYTGFSAMPAGDNGSRGNFGYSAYFWSSSTESDDADSYAYFNGVNYEVSQVVTALSSKNDGMSVRCVRGAADNASLPTISTIGTGSLPGPDKILGSDGRAYGAAEITSSGGAAITERGVCWSRDHNPTLETPVVAGESGNSHDSYNLDDNGDPIPVQGDLGAFYTQITGLVVGDCQRYYVRPYATNRVGTVYGEEVELITGDMTISYSRQFGYYEMSRVPGSLVWKTSNGDEIGHWGEGKTDTLPVDQYRLTGESECGTTINYAYPFVIPTSPICKVESINENETRYTPSYSGNYIQQLTDVENNTYSLVQIGNQCWMRENLRTKHFANGDEIAFADGAFVDNDAIIANYDYPAQNPSNQNQYGLLYNWAAAVHGTVGSSASSSVQGVCPKGWHVPSLAEYQELLDTIGTYSEFICNENPANNAAAMASTEMWNNSDVPCSIGSEATNETHFSVLPAGAHSDQFYSLGQLATLWTSTKATEEDDAYLLYMFNSATSVAHTPTQKRGLFSVRCVRGAAASLPTVKIYSAAASSVLAGIVDDGGATITEKGVCWSETPGASLSSNHVAATFEVDTFNVRAFTANPTGIEECTKYYVRAYATNSVGTAYSDEFAVVDLHGTGHGEYSSNYGNSANFARIQISNVTADSLAWKTRDGVYMGNWKGWTSVLPVGDYFIKTYHNCNGEWYGEGMNQSSYTDPELEALLAPYVDPDQGLHRIPASPICKVTSKNANETAYDASYSGNYINKLTDKSGNEYDLVQIGEQCWMRENLRTTKFADGTDITEGTTTSTTTAYRYSTGNPSTQGYLYNWSATSDAAGICPDGWHVPSDAEWTELTTYLAATQDPRSPSGESHYIYRCDDNASAIAKSLASTPTDWPSSSNTCDPGYTLPGSSYSNLNNRTGFNAVPVGRYAGGYIDSDGKVANYWTSGNSQVLMDYTNTGLSHSSEGGTMASGYSIRCIRD